MDTVEELFGTSSITTQANTPVPPQTEQPQQDELPTESVPPALAAPPMPEATSTAPPTTPAIPPIALLHLRPDPFLPQSLCHGTFIPDTDHYTQCFIPTDGKHTCSTGPTYYYPSSDSAASGTFTTPQPNIPGPSESIALAKKAIPVEETTKADVLIQPTHETTTNPSSPPETPAT
ncbi:hypothetical protein CK203_055619 [Vitis vinifera]|uniref:Uncharacterized protein n=1 Tax=Vitis vinifera TaxID=29760 RepID=A0A438FV94_VITVI|nr:hypothetical protein CK203_055619 [Vitis vinifera]